MLLQVQVHRPPRPPWAYDHPAWPVTGWGRTARGLATLSTVAMLLTVGLTALGIVTLVAIIGLVILLLGFYADVFTLAVSLLGLTALVLTPHRLPAVALWRTWRTLSVSLTVSSVIGALTLAVLAPTSALEVKQTSPPDVGRPLPVSASPVEVVETAASLAGSPPTSIGAGQLCALLVPARRPDCGVTLEVRTTSGTRLLSKSGDQAVVQYGTFIDDPLVARLEHSARGWELLDLPSDFPDSCLVRALRNKADPFACPR